MLTRLNESMVQSSYQFTQIIWIEKAIDNRKGFFMNDT